MFSSMLRERKLEKMFNIAYRNIKLFFRDKASVFFSLLAVFIIIGLYILFLGDAISSGMEEIPGVRFLMDSWIMGGLLGVTTLTTTMGAFGIMVEDKIKKNAKDFQSAPLKRTSIVGGYIFSSFMIGVIMSVLTFILAEVYIVLYGGEILSILNMLRVFGVILLAVLTCGSMVFFMVSFFKSSNAFATASTVIGTLIGFLTGVYFPVGQLPSAIQWVVKLFPVSHAGILFRQIFMEEPMKLAFENVPQQFISEFQQEMGVVFSYGNYEATMLIHILVLVVTSALFFALAVWNVSRKRK